MKFTEAFDEAFDIENERSQNAGLGKLQISKETAKTLVFFWNMLKASDFVLDDFVYLDKSLSVQSFPEEKKQKPAMAAKDKKVGGNGSGTEKS